MFNRPKNNPEPASKIPDEKFQENEIVIILKTLSKLDDFKASDLVPLLSLSPEETNQMILAINELKESEKQLLVDLAKNQDMACIRLLNKAINYAREHKKMIPKELQNRIQDSIYSFVYNKYYELYEKAHGPDDIVNSEETKINKKLMQPKAEQLRNTLFSTITSNVSDEEKLKLFKDSYQELLREHGLFDNFNPKR